MPLKRGILLMLEGVNMNVNYLKSIINKIFLTDSPSGYSKNINEVILSLVKDMGYTNYKINHKGAIEVFIPGKNKEKNIAIAAHADTLGLMVRSINADGTLKVTNVGGPSIPTLDGEYCKIFTRNNKTYTGTILSTSPAVHVYKDSSTKPRDVDNILIRIDEKVKTKQDVLDLGIENGDYICYEPKTVLTESGFLKSRFIDDKGSVCVVLSVLEYMSKQKITPNCNTYVYFTNYEEVGHGGATIQGVSEFVALDMGCIGLDLDGNEYAVSICAKDSSGPYDYELTNRLISYAKEEKISYVVDIFPYYSSDVSASLKSGLDCKGALIGSGVHASHGMERTHLDGLFNTMKLLLMYLTK